MQMTGQCALTLFAESDRRFFLTEVDAALQFAPTDGAVKAMTPKQHGQMVEFKRNADERSSLRSIADTVSMSTPPKLRRACPSVCMGERLRTSRLPVRRSNAQPGAATELSHGTTSMPR
jgi:hypothetical protein